MAVTWYIFKHYFGKHSKFTAAVTLLVISTAIFFRHTYLLLGLEDGRILFVDPVIRGQKYMEFKASKDAIREMRHDKVHSCLVTLCRLKTLVQIQMWGLPQLDLLYEVYCGPDVACYQRVEKNKSGTKAGPSSAVCVAT